MAVHRAMRSCRLADDLYLKAKYIATTEKRSFNHWLEIILQKEIAAYEKENAHLNRRFCEREVCQCHLTSNLGFLKNPSCSRPLAIPLSKKIMAVA